MKYKISKGAKPLYLQIYEQLKTDILNEAYEYKSKLPSKRIMAEELGVSVITVEHAYALLYEEGYIESVEKSGYYISFCPSNFLGRAKEKRIDTPVITVSTPQNYDFPFSVMAKTMRKVLSDKQNLCFQKSPNKGCLEFRISLAKYLMRCRGINVVPEQIIIGSGAEYLYTLVAELLGRNLTYGIESPSYEKIKLVYQACGVTLDELPLCSDGIESNALLRTDASVLHITPYKSFPTGITSSLSKKYEYINWVNKQNRFIIEDDFESEFTTSRKLEETLFSLSERVIYLNTFSKTISNGLRIGYMLLPLSLLPVYEEKLGFYSCTVPTYEQYLISELIANGEFERHINRIRRLKRRNSDMTILDHFG